MKLQPSFFWKNVWGGRGYNRPFLVVVAEERGGGRARRRWRGYALLDSWRQVGYIVLALFTQDTTGPVTVSRIFLYESGKLGVCVNELWLWHWCFVTKRCHESEVTRRSLCWWTSVVNYIRSPMSHQVGDLVKSRITTINDQPKLW